VCVCVFARLCVCVHVTLSVSRVVARRSLRLLPVLIRRLRYRDDELVDLPVEDVSDEHVPDRAEDVRPLVHRVKESYDDEDDTEVRAACCPRR
jgi:hypothetical protein